LELGEGCLHCGGIADIGFQKPVVWAAVEVSEGSGIPCIGEFVDVEHLVAALDEQADEVGSDEAGTAGDKKFHGKGR
jgi:hypothetical protein